MYLQNIHTHQETRKHHSFFRSRIASMYAALKRLRRIKMKSAGAFTVIAIFAAIVLSHLSYIPIWDGQGYAMCIMDSPLTPLSVENARCFGHPSIAYVWFQRLFQILSPGSVPLLYIANLILIAFTALSFEKLLSFLFPRQTLLEYGALVALLVFTPVLVVHVFHITPDIGAVCFFTIYLSLLIRKKYWLAALAGSALCFSKEVGAGVYIASLVALPVLVAPSFRILRTANEYVRTCRKLLPVFLPAVFISLYFLTRHSSSNANSFGWDLFSNYAADTRRLLFSSDLSDPSFGTYIFDIFALNFQWILTVVIAIASIRFLLRTAAGIFPQVNGEQVSRFLFLVLMMMASVYITTRVRPWNNARYMLLCVPLLILLFQYALESLQLRKVLTEIFLSMVAILFLLSNFYTFDPLSRFYFSVFTAGGHQMLNMNSVLNSGYGLGKDEMAYNLEFLNVTDSLREIVAELKPSQETVFFSSFGLDWQLPFVSLTEKKFTLNRSNSFSLHMTDNPAEINNQNLLKNKDGIYYIAFPNLDNGAIRDALKKNGKLSEMASTLWNDHGVHLYRFTPYSSPVALHAAADNLD